METSSEAVKFMLMNDRTRKPQQSSRSLAPKIKMSSSSLEKKEYLAYTPQANRANNARNTDSPRGPSNHKQTPTDKTALAAG
jgi:SMC interacting uncharacterized protein involved in chromosome segregation